MAPVGEASGEGSEEAAGFLVRLFKDHAIIISLDLNRSGSLDLLLLLEHWLLLDLLDIDSLSNRSDLLNVCGGATDVVIFVADILGKGTLVHNSGGSLSGLIALLADGVLGVEARESTCVLVVESTDR